ncbi:MAG: DUF1553 domain-containing protein [Verrucomicrobia bacterium]|nr:DUF1553 domain-containing protein [Verrucomicrobiota bacterium]
MYVFGVLPRHQSATSKGRGCAQVGRVVTVCLLLGRMMSSAERPSPSEHWAFQAVQRPLIPSVKDGAWCRNPIDRFVLAKLEARGWQPASEASPSALLRRVYLDLTGLPPTLAEQDAFRGKPPEAALDSVIDALLSRPAYGERWARHWLDLARYADSNGYERDAAKPFVWRYRDSVIRAFNADKPFDRFILEQLAGDELPDASAETLIATGFYRLGHWDDEPADPDADRFDQLDDIVTTTSQVFLGLTLGCARCHDHKFEPLTTRDYYSMVAVFNPLQRPQNGRSELALPAGSPGELAALAAHDQKIDHLNRENEEVRAALRETHFKSGRSKLSAEAIAAFRIAADQRDLTQKKLVNSSAKQLDSELAEVIPEETRKKLAGNQSAIDALRAAQPNLPRGYFMREPSPNPPATHVLLRGNPKRPGDSVEPAVPAITVKHQPKFPASDSRTSRRRLGLAQWLASAENPLTARVFVNRVWQQHFGIGLVRTPSDFGVMGEPPTHPELLDWLSHWFTHDAQWSVKKLHRLILTSRAWRLSRTPDPNYDKADPENRLLAHVPYRRLEVEAIRDSVLTVSGRLNPAMFGPPMFPSIPAQAIESNTDKQSVWKASDPIEQSRRTVYAFIKRGLVVPMLEVLDLCDTVNSSARRQVTTVAPQALTLFNGEFVNEQARHFAARLQREAGADTTKQIELAWRLALCRPPRPTEAAAMRDFLRRECEAARSETQTTDGSTPEEQALVQLCRVVFNLNEFVYVD